MVSIRRWLAVCTAGLALAAVAQAAEPEVTLVIKNHRFEPAELKVPAGQKIKVIVHNQDTTPEEFESHSLNREKVVPAGQKVTVFIGPLQPGRYGFFGEYNEKTAQGAIVVD
jgi:plastocyanin